MPTPRRRFLIAALLALDLTTTSSSAFAQAGTRSSCPPATAEQPFQPEIPALAPDPGLPAAVSGEASPAPDYRQHLRVTALGPARLDHWCVWVDPITGSGPAALWEGRWHRAVQAALASWSRLLPITVVDRPEQAQILIERRRPPLQSSNGRWRASHGRALLRLLSVERQGLWRLEPQVRVLIGPGQAEIPLQATALHELGHAFGLWGHSDRPGDALAAVPGPQPVLDLSLRDRSTLQWLYQQPTRFGRL
ncbi:MAG: peptidase [Cyanobacteriota bacterium]